MVSGAEAQHFGHHHWGGGSWSHNRPTWGQALASGAISGIVEAFTEAALTPPAPVYSSTGLPWPSYPAAPAYYPASGP
jgi:hypothetical protein